MNDDNEVRCRLYASPKKLNHDILQDELDGGANSKLWAPNSIDKIIGHVENKVLKKKEIIRVEGIKTPYDQVACDSYMIII